MAAKTDKGGMKMGYFTSEKIRPDVTRISCPGNVYAYLAEGKKAAVLIDTGFGVGSLKAYVDSLTSHPYVVLLTHGHLDHASGAGEFPEVYMSLLDLQLAENHTRIEERMGNFEDIPAGDFIPPLDLERYLPLTDGQNFDLGGLTVTALALPGHTPGSMAILIREHRLLLLGDACNDYGFLQLLGSSSVREYRDSLIAFRKNENLFDAVIYSHPHNRGGKEILGETIRLCEEVLTPDFTGIPVDNTQWGGGNAWLAKVVDEKGHRLDGGRANFIYREK